MAFSSALIRFLVVITPAVASELKVVRSKRVATGAWSQAAVQSKTHIGLPFWRALRQELEAKKKDLAFGDARKSSQFLAVTRRDLLWDAVREVDDKFRQRYVCETVEGTAFKKQANFLQGQTTYRKANIESARECALMCAADALGEGNRKDLTCQSFVYNKTAHECKFFNFGQQAQNGLIKDACCTSGPPCNLASMREEIQNAFDTELKREMVSVKHFANQHDVQTVEQQLQQLHDLQQSKPTVRNVEKNTEVQTTRVAPKAELKVEHKAAAQTMRFEHKAAARTVAVAPKVAHKDVAQTSHAAPKVQQKVASQTKQIVSKGEERVAMQATPIEPQIPLDAGAAKDRHLRRRTFALYALAGVLSVSTFALAWLTASAGGLSVSTFALAWLTALAGGKPKQASK